MKTTLLRAPLLALLASAVAIAPAYAGKVYFNLSDADLNNVSGAGTSASASLFVPPGNSLGFGSLIQRAHNTPTIGAIFAAPGPSLNNHPFRFELTNLAGQGISLHLTSLSNPALLNYQSSNVYDPEPYNGLVLELSTQNDGATVSFENAEFTFTDPTIQTFGTLASVGSLANGEGHFSNVLGYYTQSVESSYLVYFNDDGTQGDLSAIGWTFAADVTLNLPTNPAAYSGAGIGLFGVNGDLSPSSGSGSSSPVAAVPETSTWVMGFLALGATVFLARRKTNRQLL